jgi:SAM-dependent methyltransferase
MSEHPGGPYFRTLAETLGEAYFRYDFTRGTSQEVGFLVEALALPAGARILDVGCGPGRHAVALARRGYAVTGVDVSPRFLAIAAERARRAGVPAAFFEVDARVMPFDDEFDAVISLCQGGFGLMGDDDGLVLKRIAEATKAGGTVLLTAFNAYFEIRSSRPGATFDADKGIVHEHTTIRDEAGAERPAELWTGVYTPRELRLLAIGCGLVPEDVFAVSPGDYARRRPDLEHPELLLVARRPGRA